MLGFFFAFVRDLRKSTGVVGDTVTQLHAWWHLFAGMGTYMHLIVRSMILSKINTTLILTNFGSLFIVLYIQFSNQNGAFEAPL